MEVCSCLRVGSWCLFYDPSPTYLVFLPSLIIPYLQKKKKIIRKNVQEPFLDLKRTGSQMSFYLLRRGLQLVKFEDLK